VVARDRHGKAGGGGKKKGLTVQRAAREAPFDEGPPEHTNSIPASATEVLVVPSALAARYGQAEPPTGPAASAPVIPTIRLGLHNSSMSELSGPPSPSDAVEELDDLRTVAISSLDARDPFAGEATESFDPHGNRSSSPVQRDDPQSTVRFSVAEADTAMRKLDARHLLSSETPAPMQPEWFVNGRKVDLPRPPGGAPSVFGDVPSADQAPLVEAVDDGEPDLGGTRPTVSDAELQFTPPPPAPSRRFFWPITLAVCVAFGAGSVTAWATGLLEAESLAPVARNVDGVLENVFGVSMLASLMPAWATREEPDAEVVVEDAPTPSPTAPTPIPVRIDLVNDASGSAFAPLSDPMRDRFLATLLKIKPFVGTKKGVTPRFRFTLFIGGTDVVREGDVVKGNTTCSIAATEEGSAQPATLLKASASHLLTAKPVVVPPAKKKMSKKARAAHEKQVAAAERAEEQVRRQVARTTVSRCAFDLATSFAEKTLVPVEPPAPQSPENAVVPVMPADPNASSGGASGEKGSLPIAPGSSDAPPGTPTSSANAATKDNAPVAP
jgi:hypothetical protein